MAQLTDARIRGLIVSDEDVSQQPRVRNIIHALSDVMEFATFAKHKIKGHDGYIRTPKPSRKSHLEKPVLVRKAYSAYHRFNGELQRRFVNLRVAELKRLTDSEVSGKYFGKLDYIFCAHPWNMPLAVSIKELTGAKIILDLYEYYPGQFPKPSFKERVAPFYKRLLEIYGPQADLVVFAAPGFAALYKEEFGLDGIVFPCAVPYCKRVSPRHKSTNKKPIRLVHQGYANPSRRIEQMIDAAAGFEGEFEFHFYLKSSSRNNDYLNKLKELARKNNNVFVHDPVPIDNLVATISVFDAGIYLLPPASKNQEFLLPNKLFEFVQARLYCIVGPSKGFCEIVKEYEIGDVANSFSVDDFRQAIRGLTRQKITESTTKLDFAAEELALEKYIDVFRSALFRL